MKKVKHKSDVSKYKNNFYESYDIKKQYQYKQNIIKNISLYYPYLIYILEKIISVDFHPTPVGSSQAEYNYYKLN
jgi:hypothetical protein